MPRTNYIILRKTPFQDSSLIVAGISPDYGRLDFLLKGARSIGSKKFPNAELFREFSIEFRESKSRSGFFSMQSSDPIAFHDMIAGNLDNYLAACEHASFLLKNSQPMLEMPLTYRSMSIMLSYLGKEPKPEPWRSLAKLVFLYEGGFVPEAEMFDDVDVESAKRSRLLHSLLEYATGEPGAEKPEISDAYFARLSGWIDALITYHSLK